MTDLAVMGLFPVLAKLPAFLRLAAQADEHFDQARPDAVVLIDYPGFNWHIAKKAKSRGIPVFYYGLPQMWAWAPWRVKKVQRYVDHALCKLPFEEEWFRKRGCNATYVGHPYFDELRSKELSPQFVREQASRAGRLVTILPGSRTHEVKNNLPAFLRAAQQMVQEVSEVRFAIASYNEPQAKLARQWAAGSRLPIEVHVGRTAELIHLADCCLACSGSVSLELLYHAKPAVIHYKVSPLTAAIFRPFLLVKYITLVNLLADAELLPEYPTCYDQSAALARRCVEWLTNEPLRQSLIGRLSELKRRIVAGGASQRAAEYILGRLNVAVRRHAA